MNKQKLLALYIMINRELPSHTKGDGMMFINEILFNTLLHDSEAYTDIDILLYIYTHRSLTDAQRYLKMLLTYTHIQALEEDKLCQTITKQFMQDFVTLSERLTNKPTNT